MNQEEAPKSKKAKKKQKTQSSFVWPIKVFVLSFALTIFFSVTSELALNGSGIVVSVLVIVIFVLLAVISDMIGVAITAANVQPFRAMASKRVRGAKEAIKLLDKADRVSSICCDVIGDICGILGGAAGASIIVKIVGNSSSQALSIIVASLVSAVIASVTIFGKALGKRYSMKNCNSIILVVGKVLSVFTPQGGKKNKKKQEEDTRSDSKKDEEISAAIAEQKSSAAEEVEVKKEA